MRFLAADEPCGVDPLRIAQLAGVRFEPVAVTERRVELELLEFVVEMEGGGIPVARGAAFMQIVAVGVDPVEFEPDRLFAFGYERIESSEKFVLGEGQQRVEIPPPSAFREWRSLFVAARQMFHPMNSPPMIERA